MTYRIVMNNRSIDNLTDEYLSGALKTELGYFRYRRIPICRNRLRTATTSSGLSNAYQPTDVFYLFFENEKKAREALEKAKAIPIISLVKYKPRPTVYARPTPRAVEPRVRAPPTIHLPQEFVDIPRVALSRHLTSFVNESMFARCLRQLSDRIRLRRLKADEISARSTSLAQWLSRNPSFVVSGANESAKLLDVFFHGDREP